jgi:hypothetical protein
MVPTESARARSMNDTRNRILDIALDVLGGWCLSRGALTGVGSRSWVVT